MKLIALAGYKGVGKSTVARYISTKLSKVLINRFAEPLKQAASVIYNIHRSYWEYDKEIPQSVLDGKTKREVLQTLGKGIKLIGKVV